MSQSRAERWFVYLLRCGDGTLYTGIARDVARRLAQHVAGRGARYTRGRGPLALCAVQRCGSKSAALSLELAIKRLPRTGKQALTQPERLRAFARARAAAARRTDHAAGPGRRQLSSRS